MIFLNNGLVIIGRTRVFMKDYQVVTKAVMYVAEIFKYGLEIWINITQKVVATTTSCQKSVAKFMIVELNIII